MLSPSATPAEPHPSIAIVDGTRAPWLDVVRQLFVEYGDSLGIDLSFQRFDEELATLPGAYGEARGCLLVAAADDEPVGCVALRELDEATAELKRLYVRPAGRRHGLGRRMTEAALAFARANGYRYVVLDTLPSMSAAQRLYEGLGFVDTAPYTDNPIEGARFLRLNLEDGD